jgi:hypothetical protein
MYKGIKLEILKKNEIKTALQTCFFEYYLFFLNYFQCFKKNLFLFVKSCKNNIKDLI